MSIFDHPADDDPHGECYQEIQQLRGELETLTGFANRDIGELTGLLRECCAAVDRSHTFAFPGDLQRRIGEALKRLETKGTT